MKRWIFLFLIGALAPCLPVVGEDIDPAVIERLVRELGDDEWSLRDKATRDLIDMGEAALPLLKSWQDAPLGLEQRRRLEWILSELGELDATDRRIIDQVLKGSCSQDILTAYAAYGGKLSNYAPKSLLRGVATCGLQLDKNPNSFWRLSARLEEDEAVWIPGGLPVVEGVMDIPFPRVELPGSSNHFIDSYVTQPVDQPIYGRSGKSYTLGEPVRRITQKQNVIADIAIQKKYIPGAYSFRVLAWTEQGKVSVLDTRGRPADEFVIPKISLSELIEFDVDAFEDYDSSLTATIAANPNLSRSYGFTFDIDFPEKASTEQVMGLTIKMTPYMSQHQSYFLLPDFAEGRFLTVFWRRLEDDGNGRQKVVETVTQRLDPRERVTFFKDDSRYISLHTLQSVSRPLTVTCPKTPGNWEVLVGYGAFGCHGRTHLYQPFTTLRRGRQTCFFPQAVIPSDIYKLKITN